MFLVLFAVSLLTFYVCRGLPPPETALIPYISPRMNPGQLLALAQGLGVATHTCPSYNAFLAYRPGCVVPWYEQYIPWLQLVVFKGNWGLVSIPTVCEGISTWSCFATRFPSTVQLALLSTILIVIIAIPLGIISATHSNKVPDHASRLFALFGYSMPIFWLAFLFQIAFVLYVRVPVASGATLPLLTASGTLAQNCYLCLSNPGNYAPLGTVHPYTGLSILDGLLNGNIPFAWDSFVALVLPVITLALSIIASLTRILRSSMMEALRQDYILLARSKGLRERTVIYRHALRNAMLPPLTVTGLLFAFLLGGVIITEYIFGLPGIGDASLGAALAYQINFLELYVLVTALIIVIANLAVDVLYAFIDPRIRY
jgi:peptide/nickel transport system permease protein